MADPTCSVPDAAGRIVSRIGARIPRGAFRDLRAEYYQLRGWDRSGLPGRRVLTDLDLPEVARALSGLGLLAERVRAALSGAAGSAAGGQAG